MDILKKQLVNEMQNALFGWYDFEEGKSALVISYDEAESSEIAKYLCGLQLNATNSTLDETACSEMGRFDYLIIYNALEYCTDPAAFLCRIKSVLEDNGKVFVATDNRLAIRYFCGDKDPFSGKIFDGVDGYIKLKDDRKKALRGRCYSYYEIDSFLQKAGLINRECYSVIPDIKRPQVILAEDYKLNETLESRIFPNYNNPNTVFLEEEKLYDDLSDNGLLSKMSGGFLFECSFSSNTTLSEAKQITVQPDRGHEQSLATIISDNTVTKKPLYKEGNSKIEILTENTKYLIDHGVNEIYSETKDNQYKMPFVNGTIATLYFREQAKKGRKEFLEALTKWRNIIENSSEHVDYSQINWKHFDPYWKERKADDPNIEKWERLANGSDEDKKEIGVILKRGYLDLVSLNCIHHDDEFMFFDQEFYVENFPANTIMIRTIDLIYREYLDIEALYPRDELLKDLHLYEHREMWRKKADAFLDDLTNNTTLKEYHQKTRRNRIITETNRFRMNYSLEEYDKLFRDIFKNTDIKKVYLFGSGVYAKMFVDTYGAYLSIAGVLDNNEKVWGNEFAGVKISAPDVLLDEQEDYKVIICIKYYDDVYKQLQNMGVKDISIYETRIGYERPVKLTITQNKNEEKKKYHIGYVAGVFDLFHLGHVNLLRRAKEQCDYLIVGVVSDEQIISGKGTTPYMTYDERSEIVASCKYVDEVVPIPLGRSDTEDAWRLYRFDAQFSGSDYENDPKWLAKQQFLRERGSELVFFPYTQSVSSTKLKEKIRK